MRRWLVYSWEEGAEVWSFWAAYESWQEAHREQTCTEYKWGWPALIVREEDPAELYVW